MAGQPPDPSYPTGGPDQAQTRGRPAWQPSYPPPPAQQPDEAGQDYETRQEYRDGQAQAYQAGQDYQAYPPPGYGQPGRTAPQRTRARSERGFIGSLFDFSFTSMVTPKIIKALYGLFTAWSVVWALIFLGISIHFRQSWGTPFIFITLIIIDPIFILLTLGVYRVVLESFMVVFRIYEETRKIRENSDPRD